MDNWFKSKWFVRLLSLAFAILLYVVVNIEAVTSNQNDPSLLFPSGSEELEKLEDVPVQIRIDGEKYVVSGVPEYVTVSLEGAAGVLTPTARQRNFDVFVDLRGLGQGDHTVEIDHANVPSELKVYIEPKTIDVTIEERSIGEFKVNADFINTDKLPEGYELGEIELNPEVVTITSSKNIIDKISIVKVFVDVADLTESIKNREVPVKVYDSQGNELRARIEPENVVVSVEVDNPSKTVPVSVSTTGTLPEAYALTSINANIEEVEVFATSKVLEDLSEIVTEEIDLSKVTKSGTINTSLNLPKGAQTPGVEEVEVAIELEQTRTINEVPIEIENKEDGQDISFINPDKPMMGITVVGNEEDVSSLKSDDFTITIDVAGLGEGEHRLPVTIEGPDNVTVDGEFADVLIEIR